MAFDGLWRRFLRAGLPAVAVLLAAAGCPAPPETRAPRADTTASWVPPPPPPGDTEFSLDVPNGLSSRCACDFQSPPACSCGGDLPPEPKADPGSSNKLGSVGAIAYSPDGALFAVSHGERVFLLDASTLRERFHLEGHTAFVRALVLGPDGKTLISGADDRTSRR